MSAATGLLKQSSELDVSDGVRMLATLPEWLLDALRPERVLEELARCDPECAAGALTLRGCKIRRLVLKNTRGRWVGSYAVGVERPATGERRTVALRGTLIAPGFAPPDPAPVASAPFGEAGWRCNLPDLGLELEPEPPDEALAVLPRVTDAQEVRGLLEAGMRAGLPEYRDLRLSAVTPDVISYKPGSRCTLRYHLEYPADLADRGWPAQVIAKTYSGSKGQHAYDGMRKMWDAPALRGDAVTIAAPLAYIPELKLLIQGLVPEEQSLETFCKAALASGDPAALDALREYLRKTAAGLVALHQSGAQHGETITWSERMAELDKLVDRIGAVAPELVGAAGAVRSRLVELDAAHPADPLVPTHGAFDPEQVTLDGERIGFIDFDDFCLAEPAMDIGMFLAALSDLGLKAGEDALPDRAARMARLDQIDALGQVFVDAYAALAPISRPRVALWQAIDFFSDALHCWTKVKLVGPENDMLILEHHMRGMGLW